jgi:hypothetical protein
MSCFVLFYVVVPLWMFLDFKLVAIGCGWLGAEKISFFGCFCILK